MAGDGGDFRWHLPAGHCASGLGREGSRFLPYGGSGLLSVLGVLECVVCSRMMACVLLSQDDGRVDETG